MKLPKKSTQHANNGATQYKITVITRKHTIPQA